jgi:hypothetical protein
MAFSKVEQFLGSEYEAIMNETRESRSFCLGLAYGYYQIYKYLESEYSNIEGTNMTCKYFNKLIEADDEPDSKADELYQRLRKFV